MGFIDSAGNYYEGMKAHPSHQEVPKRPSSYHNWDGQDWIEDTVKKKADEDAATLELSIQQEIRTLATESIAAKALPAEELAKEALIEEELRTMAIDSLKAKGKWIE